MSSSGPIDSEANGLLTADVKARAVLLRAELARYRDEYPERRALVDRMLALVAAPDAFSRSHLDPGHFTASAFVLCPERRRLLLVHHQKLERWLQPGGHIEAEDPDLRAAAEREVREETGACNLTTLRDGIFDVDIHVIPSRPQEGAHQHFDVRYVFVAPSDELVVSEEVRGARWVELARVADLNSEESILRCVRQLA